MFRKSFVLLLVTVCFTAGMVQAEEDFVIQLNPGQTGENLDPDTMDWPDWIDNKIQQVNDEKGMFWVEIYNGPTEWTVARQLAAADTTGQVKAHHLDIVLDAALNVAREQQVNRLLRAKGLVRMDVCYVRDRSTKGPFISIYFSRLVNQLGVVTAPVVTDGDDFMGPPTPGDTEVTKINDGVAPDGDSGTIITSSDATRWTTKANAGLLAYINGRIDQEAFAFKLGVTFKKDDRRWDLSLGGSGGGSDELGNMAEVVACGVHSWMPKTYHDEPDTNSSEVETEEEESESSVRTRIGPHFGAFVGSRFYTDVNEYNQLSYGLLVGATWEATKDITVFLSWAPALSDRLGEDLHGTLGSMLAVAQVEF